MTIASTLVGSASGNGSPRTTSAGTTATGDTLVILLSHDATAGALTISDNKGNTYTQVGTGVSNGGHVVRIYYCENATGGAGHTASAAYVAGDFFGTIYLFRLTVAATASFDKSQTSTDATSPYTWTLPVLSQADEAILSIHSSAAGGTVAYASSNTTILATEADGNSFWTSAVSAVVVASTAAFTPSFTGGDTATASMSATFKAAGGGGGAVANAGRLSLLGVGV